MLNRRLIRVKVLQALYAYHQSEHSDKKTSLAFLKKSILGIEDTFINCFQFADDFFNYVQLKYNPAGKHLQAGREELNSFRWLSGNECLEMLEKHPNSAGLFQKPSVNWTRDEDFLNLMYREIAASAWFIEFIGQQEEGFDAHRNFLMRFYKYLIETSEEFNARMEEINIHWQDEKIPVLKSLEKLLKSCTDAEATPELPALSKDLEDDLIFAEHLLDTTIRKHDAFEEMISKRTPEWDPERIARMDLYIMVMALSEFTEFASIPVKVTMNEYLELAKIYSTPQSSRFINGILDKMMAEMKKEGMIKKSGRGLVE